MSSLSKQRLIIHELECSTAIDRTRLSKALGAISPPVSTIMVTAGTALIVADMIPGIYAIAQLIPRGRGLQERRTRLSKAKLEVPRLLRALRHLRT